MAYVDEISTLPGGTVHLAPQDEVGLLDMTALLGASGDAVVYACGPEPMLKALDAAATGMEVAPTVQVERFAPSARAGDPPVPGSAFTVELRKSGHILTIAPDENVLDRVLSAVSGVPYSCREGMCGSCEVRVLEGVPDHLDDILTDDERASNETMMICVSRALTPRIALDL